MGTFKAAAVQMDSGADRNENLKKIREYVYKAKDKGAELIVLPETSDYIGNDFAKNSWDIIEAQQFFAKLAEDTQTYLHCGSITEKTEGKPKNTSMLFSQQGVCLGKYSKLHMFDVEVKQGPSYKESDEIQVGNKLTVAKTSLATLGFAVCYDIRFPEMFRLMTLHGAQVFCVCANFTMATGKDHWESILRTRAIENGCYIIAADQIGNKPKFAALGQSMIIDPWGNVIASSSNREDIVIAEIDTNYVNQVRNQIPTLVNRRIDMYQLEGNVEIQYEEMGLYENEKS